MSYLLDTNACIAMINGKIPVIRTRLQKVIAADEKVWISSIVAFELWYGIVKSARPDANTYLLEKFFAGPIGLLSFEAEDAKVAGRIRAGLESVGRPIGAYDLLIAGQALRHRMLLVTANGREFSRIKGLEWEDWARA